LTRFQQWPYLRAMSPSGTGGFSGDDDPKRAPLNLINDPYRPRYGSASRHNLLILNQRVDSIARETLLIPLLFLILSKRLDRRMNMQQQVYRGIRKRSAKSFCGLALWDIAIGPDLEKNEIRGRAHGIIAIGDIAKGWLAIGGVATGGIAFGGVSVGLVSIGGLGIGLLALGGLAIGGIAIGGAAIGIVAIGGGALGYYAFGGGAFGKHTISAMQRSQEAIDFFSKWFPFLPLK